MENQTKSHPSSAPSKTDAPTTTALILQWLTYAFWGWAVLSLSVLTGLVIFNFLKGSDNGDSTPYAIAAVIVLLPISVLCDYLYSKTEPYRKTGAAQVIMVIHAVIFALFGIGALIIAVFSLVRLATSSGDATSTLSALYTAIIIALIYGITFVRTLNPVRGNWIKKVYTTAMIVVVGIITVLGFIGPVASARLIRDDKLIEQNLPNLSQSISNYAQSNNKLPTSLNELQLTGDTRQLTVRNLVKYTANTKPSIENNTISSRPVPAIYPPQSINGKQFFYTLCVTYKKAKQTDPSFQKPMLEASPNSGYIQYVDSFMHPSGNVCYKLIAGNSYGEPVPLDATAR